MSKNQAGWIIFLLMIIIAFCCFFTLKSLKNKVAWEYKLESTSDYAFDDEINEYGNDGWELLFARRATSSYSDGACYEMIFKQEK
ncbi:MAG: hypothetical protein APR54_11260 [Candidatus Cloacimonas sp. SDB]|nr:MAG: hypothetical protein APR54_11260 [Candidatus Cloacimonas sp. SDB]